MEHFLYGAENVCKKNHLRRPLLIFRNDGNSSRVAKTTALKTWGSGPRGGLEGTLAYARLYDVGTMLSMDIGGTTTDVSMINGQQIALMAHGEVDEFETSFALPNLDSVGLGGSSIISIAEGKLKIGPDSVGASPGPACFARGGTEATLTDALLLAGLLDAEGYLGGELKLDRQRAAQAINTKVGEPLQLSEDAATLAVIDAFEKQAGAVLRGAAEAGGGNLSDATLLAYGGGGPMIACGIAKAAGIRRIIIRVQQCCARIPSAPRGRGERPDKCDQGPFDGTCETGYVRRRRRPGPVRLRLFPVVGAGRVHLRERPEQSAQRLRGHRRP
jgi:N-methylhydantoinase A/oxoprolinase/acetone carboxylase beta subunit